jgi:hypothetical protein
MGLPGDRKGREGASLSSTQRHVSVLRILSGQRCDVTGLPCRGGRAPRSVDTEHLAFFSHAYGTLPLFKQPLKTIECTVISILPQCLVSTSYRHTVLSLLLLVRGSPCGLRATRLIRLTVICLALHGLYQYSNNYTFRNVLLSRPKDVILHGQN